MKYEEKFIVINNKRFEELNFAYSNEPELQNQPIHPANTKLLNAIDEWAKEYKYEIGVSPNQKYYVVNQDEPYANKVWQLIKEGEEVSEKNNNES